MTMRRGFTLIELTVVIAIIGLLASVVLVTTSGSRAKTRDAKRVDELQSIQKILAQAWTDAPLTGAGCANGGKANACAQLTQFSDPIGSAVCTKTSTSPCQYVIYGKGSSQPTNGVVQSSATGYEICAYLESGVTNIRSNKGLVYITSDSPLVQSGCPNF